MQYLTAAVGLVGSLCLLDLVLTLGVVRRLRDHTERLTALSGVSRPAASSDSLLPVGSVPDDFGVSTLDGSLVSRELLGAPALVAFFTPGCAPCRERVPEFVEYASGVPVGRDRTLAGVVGAAGAARGPPS